MDLCIDFQTLVGVAFTKSIKPLIAIYRPLRRFNDLKDELLFISLYLYGKNSALQRHVSLGHHVTPL